MSFEENLDESIEKCVQFDTLDTNIEININEEERDEIAEKILEWLNANPVRSISSVDDFFQLVSDLLEIEVTRDGRLRLRKSSRSNQEIVASMKRNKDFFSSAIKRSERVLEEDYEIEYVNESDELLLLRFIENNKQIIEGMKSVENAISKFSFSRKRHRYTRRFLESIYDFSDTIILLILRWMEIEGNRGTNKEKLSLELLEWDINTFKDSLYNLRKIAQIPEQESVDKEEQKHLAEVIVQLLQ